MRTIDKLFKIVDSCKTIDQYENALKMVFRCHTKRCDNIGMLMSLLAMEDFALAKGKTILFNQIIQDFNSTKTHSLLTKN